MKYYELECGCKFPIREDLPPVNGKPAIFLDLEFDNMNLECKATWDLLSSGKTKGIFQLETSIGKNGAKKSKPNSIEVIAILEAVIRPGTSQSIDPETGLNMAELYYARRNGTQETKYLHPALEPILKNTEGIISFQEQSLKIATDLAGFNMVEANILRSGIGKKLPEVIAKMKILFIEKAKTAGILSDDEAKAIFDIIEKSQRYSFAKSHATPYAYLCFKTAYCKAHFPLEFFTAYLHHAQDSAHPKEEIQALINDANEFGFKVYPPRFTNITEHFTYENIEIFFGLADVDRIGETHVNKLLSNIEELENKTGKQRTTWTWYEFLTLFSDMSSVTVITNMIKVGGMRHLPLDRRKMLHEYNSYNQLTPTEKTGLAELNQPLHKMKAVKNRDPITNKLTSEKDSDGNVIYVKELDDNEDPIILDEPRPVFNLINGIEELLKRPGAVTKKRREKVESILKLLQDPPTSLKDDPYWITKTEEELLTVAISQAKIESVYSSRADTTIEKFKSIKRSGFNDRFTIAAEILSYREIKIKKGDNRGKPMGFLVLKDTTGILEDVTAFTDIWLKVQNFVHEGNLVEITGRRDENRGSFIVEDIHQL